MGSRKLSEGWSWVFAFRRFTMGFRRICQGYVEGHLEAEGGLEMNIHIQKIHNGFQKNRSRICGGSSGESCYMITLGFRKSLKDTWRVIWESCYMITLGVRRIGQGYVEGHLGKLLFDHKRDQNVDPGGCKICNKLCDKVL